MDKEAWTKWKKARTGLVLDQPFFASIMMRMNEQEDPTCQTAWTDGKTIAFNPAWLNTLTLDEVKGLVSHEVLHVALLHNLRRDQRDPGKWNQAGDYAINPIIEEAGLTLPPNGLNDPIYKDHAAEEIYNSLPTPPPGGGKGKGKGGTPGQHPGTPGGTGTGGDPGGYGEVRDFPGTDGKPATPAEKAQQEQQQKIDTQNAATAAKRAGKLPGSLERLIDELLEPVIPWKEVLARFVDTHAANDYTWTTPNKRYASQGLYLPALRNPELGHILLAVDTSGSISQQQITDFVSEIRGILRTYDKTSLTVIFCDADIQGEPQTLEGTDEAETLKPQGGGGTSFVPPFEWAAENGIEPKAAIYFTDGYCSSFPEAPDFDTLWILTEKNESFQPLFGEVIHMEKE